VPDYAERGYCARNEYCVSLNPVVDVLDEIVERFRVEEQT
jgi:hypothetical protein